MGGAGAGVAGVIVDGGSFDWTITDDQGRPRFPGFTTPDPSYHGAVFADLGAPAYALKARVQLLRDLGSAVSPFNAFLIAQGIETLSLRIERHVANAVAVAQFLTEQPEVESVAYAGLASSPWYERGQRLAPKGVGAIVSFELAGGVDAGKKFVDALTLHSHVANIGDVRSLVIHPPCVRGAPAPPVHLPLPAGLGLGYYSPPPRPAEIIRHRRLPALGLVQCQMHQLLAHHHAGAVHPDHGVLRVDAQALFAHDHAVDLDAALGDHVLGGAPGGDAGLGQHLLQALTFTPGQFGVGAGGRLDMLALGGLGVAQLRRRGGLALRLGGLGLAGRLHALGPAGRALRAALRRGRRATALGACRTTATAPGVRPRRGATRGDAALGRTRIAGADRAATPWVLVVTFPTVRCAISASGCIHVVLSILGAEVQIVLGGFLQPGVAGVRFQALVDLIDQVDPR